MLCRGKRVLRCCVRSYDNGVGVMKGVCMMVVVCMMVCVLVCMVAVAGEKTPGVMRKVLLKTANNNSSNNKHQCPYRHIHGHLRGGCFVYSHLSSIPCSNVVWYTKYPCMWGLHWWV